jgi:hypothetical protein
MGTHDEKCNLSTYIDLLSFIYSIKSSFLVNLGAAAVEETGSSGVDDGGGDRRSRERR